MQSRHTTSMLRKCWQILAFTLALCVLLAATWRPGSAFAGEGGYDPDGRSLVTGATAQAAPDAQVQAAADMQTQATSSDAQDAQPDMQALAIGESKHSALAKENDFSQWFSFTPDHDGVFLFRCAKDEQSSGTWPLFVGTLYVSPIGDGQGSSELMTTSSEDSKIGYRLQQDQTCYLKCGYDEYDSDTSDISFSISVEEVDPFDISKLIVNSNSKWEEGESQDLLADNVFLMSWDRGDFDSPIYLKVSDVCTVSWQQRHRDSAQDEDVFSDIDQAPSEPGAYRAILKGKDPYYGTVEVDFTLGSYNPYDIGNCSFGEGAAFANEAAVTFEGLGISGAFEGGDDSIDLTCGEDFEVGGWFTAIKQGSEWSAVDELSAAPGMPGDYMVRLVGIGSYHGVKDVYFAIKDADDIANFDGNAASFDSTGDPVKPEDLYLTLSRYDSSTGDWIELEYDVDFEVEGWYASDGYDSVTGKCVAGEKLPAAPSDAGDYIVRLVGKGHYYGTKDVEFSISGSHDESDIVNYLSDNGGPDVATMEADGMPATLERLGFIIGEYDYEADNLIELTEGVDYEIEGWYRDDSLDQEPQRLDSAPSGIGSYSVEIRGIGQYHGEGGYHFTIYSLQDFAEQGLLGWDVELNEKIWADGTPISLEKLGLNLCREILDYVYYLEYGKDYTLDGWYTSEYGWASGEFGLRAGKRLDRDAPVEPGVYFVRLAGAQGGSLDVKFELIDPHDLSGCDSSRNSIWSNGEPVTIDRLNVRLSSGAGEQVQLEPEVDFQLDSWWDGYRNLELDGAPSEPGSYRAKFVGKGAFTGAKYVDFTIVDSYDLGNYEFYVNDEIAYDGTPLTAAKLSMNLSATVENDEEVTLKLNRDFKVSQWCSDSYYYGYDYYDDEGYDYDYGDYYADNGPTNGTDLGDITNAGYYVVTVEGIGQYKGSADHSFRIAPAALSKVTFGKIAAATYTGKALKPVPKITFGGKTLKKGTDYTLSYKNNVKVGKAKVVIEGMGNFEGTKTLTFTIGKAAISKAKVAKLAACAYTGKAVKPVPKVTFGGKTLKKGTDYTLSYKNNKKAGKARMTIKGKGNFKGSKVVTFKVTKSKVSLAKATVGKIKVQKLKKKGKAVKPKVEVTYQGIKLKAGKDYTVTYKNNKKKGTAKAIIKGKGAYKGSKTVKFTVK